MWELCEDRTAAWEQMGEGGGPASHPPLRVTGTGLASRQPPGKGKDRETGRLPTVLVNYWETLGRGGVQNPVDSACGLEKGNKASQSGTEGHRSRSPGHTPSVSARPGPPHCMWLSLPMM